MKSSVVIRWWLMMVVLCVLPVGAFAQQTKQQPKEPQKVDQENFDAKIEDAKSRFNDGIKEGQERFDNQINNPGQTIKKKSKKEKKQKTKKEKIEKPTADRDLVEIKCEPAQSQAKTGSFKQQVIEPTPDRIVRGVRTSAAVPIANITPEKARFEAIRLAKEEALRIVVGEEINASTTIMDNGVQEATMARVSMIGSRGGVVGLELIKDSPVVDANGASRYEVEIVADVKIYEESANQSISFDVEGVKHGYSHRDRLQFSVTPSDSCYVYIFLFDSRGAGTQLVPSRFEPVNCLAREAAHSFPSNRAIQYTLTLDNPLSVEETNTLIVVTFRNPVPITQSVCSDIEKTLCWIYSFDPSQRSANIDAIPIRIYAAK